MQLGDIRIEGVRDGTSYLSADFFGKTEGEAHASMLGDDGRLQLPIAGFVIHTGGKRVLMDAGMGPVTMSGNPTKVPRRGWKAAVFPRRCPPGDRVRALATLRRESSRFTGHVRTLRCVLDELFWGCA
jgi:hypothetical protein